MPVRSRFYGGYQMYGSNKIELFYVEKSEGLGFVYQLHFHESLVLILSFLLLSSMWICTYDPRWLSNSIR